VKSSVLESNFNQVRNLDCKRGAIDKDFGG